MKLQTFLISLFYVQLNAQIFNYKFIPGTTNVSVAPALVNCAAVYTDKTLYIIGGEKTLDGTPNDEVWSYDISTKKWTKIQFTKDTTAGNAYVARSKTEAVLYKDKVYLFGGTTNNALTGANVNQVYFYSITSKVFAFVQTTGVPPTAGWGYAVALLTDYVYVFGGSTVNATTMAGPACVQSGMNDVFRFDLKTFSWGRLPAAATNERTPTKRLFASMVGYNNALFVVNGASSFCASSYVAELWKFTLDTRIWTLIPGFDLWLIKIFDCSDTSFLAGLEPRVATKDNFLYMYGTMRSSIYAIEYLKISSQKTILIFNMETSEWKSEATLSSVDYVSPLGCGSWGLQGAFDNVQSNDLFWVTFGGLNISNPTGRTLTNNVMIVYIPEVAAPPSSDPQTSAGFKWNSGLGIGVIGLIAFIGVFIVIFIIMKLFQKWKSGKEDREMYMKSSPEKAMPPQANFSNSFGGSTVGNSNNYGSTNNNFSNPMAAAPSSKAFAAGGARATNSFAQPKPLKTSAFDGDGVIPEDPVEAARYFQALQQKAEGSEGFGGSRPNYDEDPYAGAAGPEDPYGMQPMQGIDSRPLGVPSYPIDVQSDIPNNPYGGEYNNPLAQSPVGQAEMSDPYGLMQGDQIRASIAASKNVRGNSSGMNANDSYNSANDPYANPNAGLESTTKTLAKPDTVRSMQDAFKLSTADIQVGDQIVSTWSGTVHSAILVPGNLSQDVQDMLQLEGNEASVKIWGVSKSFPDGVSEILALRELIVLTKTRGTPNVVQLIAYSDESPMHFVLSPFKTTLYVELRDENEFQWDLDQTKRNVSASICTAAGYLHSLALVHNRINPKSILLRYLPGAFEPMPLLSDFAGVMSYSEDQDLARVNDGAFIAMQIRYSAPQVLKNIRSTARDMLESCSAASDIFSFGMVLYEIITRQMPHAELDEKAVRAAISEGRPLAVSEDVQSKYGTLVKIMQKCTELKPEDRYDSFSTIWSDLQE